MKRMLKSKIHEYFSPDLLVEIAKVPYMSEGNELKAKYIYDLFKDYGITCFPLGSGTNRIGVQIQDAVFKIALDKHGKMDNMREFKYTDKLQPYVIKVYECLPDGLVIACEPFIPMTQDDFIGNKEEILSIISIMAKNFFIGDIGYDPNKNYANWGFRKTDGQIGILDFAYIYSVHYNTFTCTCEERPFLTYDDNFVNMICPSCGRKWKFGEVRKRIRKEDEEKEIGDIKILSYNLTKPKEVVEVNTSYTESIYTDIRKKKEKMTESQIQKERIEKIRENVKLREARNFNELDEYDKTSFAEIIKGIQDGFYDKKL